MAYFRAGRCQPQSLISFTPVNCGVASGASSPASTLFLFFRGPLTRKNPQRSKVVGSQPYYRNGNYEHSF